MQEEPTPPSNKPSAEDRHVRAAEDSYGCGLMFLGFFLLQSVFLGIASGGWRPLEYMGLPLSFDLILALACFAFAWIALLRAGIARLRAWMARRQSKG
jgi:hypothetical protein